MNIAGARLHPASEESFIDLIRRNGMWIVVLLAVASSISGLRNGFALDDVAVVFDDARLHELSSAWHAFTQTYWLPKYGASLYRPLTSLGFAFQWAIGGGSPFPFHVVSIALYAGVCAAVLRLARSLFDADVALLGAAIFAVHPVHVEAVANVVGQAELGATLFVVLATTSYIRMRESGIGVRGIAALSMMYACALGFKENAVVLPALIVAADFLPSPSSQTTRSRLRRLSFVLLSLAVVAAVFIVVRTSVIGNLTGAGDQARALAGQPFITRLLTMLRVVLEWIRLFVWPASLSADYSPPRISTAREFDAVMIPAIAVLSGAVAIAWRLRKDQPGATFSLLWTGITLLIPSNLIVITGFILAERALFLPSVGVAMLLGAGAVMAIRHLPHSAHRMALVTVFLLIAAGFARSSYRNPVWKDNEVLFRQTAEDVPTSWRAHIMLGELLVMQGKSEGLMEMALAVRLSPGRDPQVRYFAAHRLYRSKKCPLALPYYRELIEIEPANAMIRAEAADCLAQTGKLAEAIAVATEGLKLSPRDARLEAFLGMNGSAVGTIISPPE